MSGVVEKIKLTKNARLVVVHDTDALCPRGDWHLLTGFVKIPGRGDSRLSDVPEVWDPPLPILDAHERILDRSRVTQEGDVQRWARVFHGLSIVYDSEHGGYWFVAGADASSYATDVDVENRALFRDNFPDLVPCTQAHLDKQDEVIDQERETYRQWADGEVYGVVLQRRARWIRVDSNDEPVFLVDGDLSRETWEDVDSIWSCYLDDTYTAKVVADEHFDLTKKERKRLRST